MTRTIEVFAPAKINLTLHVTGQRDDGYHLLDSLVCFADVGDVLRLTPADGMSMAVCGPFAEGVPCDARNLAWRAAELAGWRGHIALEKNLPHGAGIGGGSSDAGAVLRALGHADDAVALGADVPVCCYGRSARMSGVGERVEPIGGIGPLDAILVNPGVHVPTPQVFKALERKDGAPMTEIPATANLQSFVDWLRAQRNDLEAPARELAPAIDDVLHALDATDPYISRMSGSGATCFALYETPEAARLHARALADRHPDWWVCPVTLN